MIMQCPHFTNFGLNDREKSIILRTASNRTTSIVGICRTCGIDTSKSTMWRMLEKYSNIVQSRMKKCLQVTQGHNGERLHYFEFRSST
uniref:HTH_Tnp_Tc3_1 domain-containing protein n=1 Tax=Heterorhabditis bacteriophora TaxID=37862 RepID=A0A1I7WCK0_HETBA